MILLRFTCYYVTPSAFLSYCSGACSNVEWRPSNWLEFPTPECFLLEKARMEDTQTVDHLKRPEYSTPVKGNVSEKDSKKHATLQNTFIICVSIISCIFLKKFGLNPITTILFWQFLSGNVFRPSSIRLNFRRSIRELGIRANGGDPIEWVCAIYLGKVKVP
jgi:hypothetical protein